MNNRSLFAWVFVLLAPLIPVVLLYILFQNQNYFELTKPESGILALGPIAAYFGLVVLGWQIYNELEKRGRVESPLFRELLGEWDMESQSIHGSMGNGDLQIEEKQGELIVSGCFRESGREIAQWNSEFAGLKDHRLYIYYNLTQVRNEGPVEMKGMCCLSIPGKPVNAMEGSWLIVGQNYTAGEMKCTKKVRRR